MRTLDTILKKPGVKGKRVLVRVDLNVPMLHGKVSDDTRIQALVPTLSKLLQEKAKVIVISHFGRPDGQFVRDMSLAPLTNSLEQALGTPVKFALDCIGEKATNAVDALQEGEILVLENVRFYEGEEKNDPEFARQLASLADYFVNDTFSCSHRTHASIIGVADYLPSVAGLLLEQEISSLEKIISKPKRPMGAIVGGSKVSTKLGLLEALIDKVDMLAIGGGMANTFLHALGHEVADSLCEKEMKATAEKIYNEARKKKCNIILPKDVVVADALQEKAECQVYNIDDMPKKGMILDIGPETAYEITTELKQCKTVVWNGPLGAFEYTPFDVGTTTVARTISRLTEQERIISLAGGGDVLSALARAGLKQNFSYISTAGGAFLEWLEGKELPGIKILNDEQKLLQAMGS